MLEDGLDLSRHKCAILASPSPRHVPVASRVEYLRVPGVRGSCSRSRSPVSRDSGSVGFTIEQLENTVAKVVRLELSQILSNLNSTQATNGGKSKEACGLEQEQAVQSMARPMHAHDLQVLKTDSEILVAVDNFWGKFSTARIAPRANVTVVFEPHPPVTCALALNQRVEAAFGCRILTKGEVCDKTPFGVAGGQKGQPCVVIHFKNSNKLTIQVQARKMNVVVKGRRQAFSPEAVRALLPFLGRAVEVKTSTATQRTSVVGCN